MQRQLLDFGDWFDGLFSMLLVYQLFCYGQGLAQSHIHRIQPCLPGFGHIEQPGCCIEGSGGSCKRLDAGFHLELIMLQRKGRASRGSTAKKHSLLVHLILKIRSGQEPQLF